MSDLNRVTLIGNIGQEPEFKYFESGACLTTFSLGVKRYDAKSQKDITDWFNVKTFSKLGEYTKKGIKIAVDGELQTSSWEAYNGKKMKNIYILADKLQILTPPKDKEG